MDRKSSARCTRIIFKTMMNAKLALESSLKKTATVTDKSTYHKDAACVSFGDDDIRFEAMVDYSDDGSDEVHWTLSYCHSDEIMIRTGRAGIHGFVASELPTLLREIMGMH